MKREIPKGLKDAMNKAQEESRHTRERLEELAHRADFDRLEFVGVTVQITNTVYDLVMAIKAAHR